MTVDLHTHSTASDGTDAPTELLRAAASAGLTAVAITDHDTTAGWADAVLALPPGLSLVRGAEISCRHAGISLHLLAYLFDPGEPTLAAALRRVRESRLPRARAMVDRLRAAGVDLSWQDVLAHVAPDATVGRPHIADALVARGIVRDRDEAFAGVLSSGSAAYVPHFSLDPITAVRAVRRAGGVPVLAHPFARARGQVLDEDAIVAMAEAGLAGLEVHHRDHSPADVRRLIALAHDLGLLATGSSDYHGTGKPNRLGEHLTDPAVLEAIVVQATGVPVLQR